MPQQPTAERSEAQLKPTVAPDKLIDDAGDDEEAGTDTEEQSGTDDEEESGSDEEESGADDEYETGEDEDAEQERTEDEDESGEEEEGTKDEDESGEDDSHDSAATPGSKDTDDEELDFPGALDSGAPAGNIDDVELDFPGAVASETDEMDLDFPGALDSGVPAGSNDDEELDFPGALDSGAPAENVDDVELDFPGAVASETDDMDLDFPGALDSGVPAGNNDDEELDFPGALDSGVPAGTNDDEELDFPGALDSGVPAGGNGDDELDFPGAVASESDDVELDFPGALNSAGLPAENYDDIELHFPGAIASEEPAVIDHDIEQHSTDEDESGEDPDDEDGSEHDENEDDPVATPHRDPTSDDDIQLDFPGALNSAALPAGNFDDIEPHFPGAIASGSTAGAADGQLHPSAAVTPMEPGGAGSGKFDLPGAVPTSGSAGENLAIISTSGEAAVTPKDKTIHRAVSAQPIHDDLSSSSSGGTRPLDNAPRRIFIDLSAADDDTEVVAPAARHAAALTPTPSSSSKHRKTAQIVTPSPSAQDPESPKSTPSGNGKAPVQQGSLPVLANAYRLSKEELSAMFANTLDVQGFLASMSMAEIPELHPNPAIRQMQHYREDLQLDKSVDTPSQEYLDYIHSEEALYSYDTQLAGISIAAHAPPPAVISLAYAERLAQYQQQREYMDKLQHQRTQLSDVSAFLDSALDSLSKM